MVYIAREQALAQYQGLLDAFERHYGVDPVEEGLSFIEEAVILKNAEGWYVDFGVIRYGVENMDSDLVPILLDYCRTL